MSNLEIENNKIILPENLNRYNVPNLLKKVKAEKIDRVDLINYEHLSSIDSAGVAFIDKIRLDYSGESPIKMVNMSTKIKAALKTFSSLDMPEIKKKERSSFFENLGELTYLFIYQLFYGLVLAADIFYWSIGGLLKKKGQRKGAFSQQSLQIGVDALPILTLLSFIIGLIIALQSAAQLKRFGANIYIADLIAISMVREMGPMMTAIIIAGRSGSAIAAEIATMKVTEEIDALKVMAINPVRYVVVPKLHAITICMPILVVYAIIVGIAGGLIIAVTYLELSVVSFIASVFDVLAFKDIFVSLIKSIFFAWVIVIIGSYYGFNVKGGAEGVGKATTKSVVASIFAVIVLDAIFSFLFLPQ